MSVALRHSSRLFAVVAILAVTACSKGPPQSAGFHGFPPADVTVRAVEPQTFPVSFQYVGQTQGSKDVEVRARVTGIIERRLYQEGSFVKAGQPLFVIDARPYEAQVAAARADVARAEAQKAQADREYARLKPLAERKAIGQKEADDAASAADLAAAGVKVAQAKLAELSLNLGYTKVLAPIAGLSSRAQKSEGSLATQNETLLTTISQIDPIWIVFNVSENEQLRLSRAVGSGQLKLPADNEKGKIAPAFDYRNVAVPRGFRPGFDLFKKKSLLERVVDLLAGSSMSEAEAQELIGQKQEHLSGYVTPEVAGLIVGKERGLDVQPYIDEAFAGLVKK
jgi:membrane fusion protein (multidrug efflux system)